MNKKHCIKKYKNANNYGVWNIFCEKTNKLMAQTDFNGILNFLKNVYKINESEIEALKNEVNDYEGIHYFLAIKGKPIYQIDYKNPSSNCEYGMCIIPLDRK